LQFGRLTGGICTSTRCAATQLWTGNHSPAQHFIVPQVALEAPYQENIYGHKAEDRALFNQPPLAAALSRNDSGNAF
jgi:hypothetical protein